MFSVLRNLKNTSNYVVPKSYARLWLSNRAMSAVNAKEYLEVCEVNGIREITLNHGKTRNSLSMDMMSCMHAELCKDLENKELRCIVLTAKGPVWSAGHNLKEMIANNEPTYHKAIFDKLTDIIMTIKKVPVPVIAKVNGLAAAAGCQLVASCDIIVSSDKSQFSTPGANFGVFCSTPGIALARVMQRPKSAYMVLTGLPITAQEAYVAGLVSRVVPESELDAEMATITKAILAKSRTVIAFGKQFYYKQLSLNTEEAYQAGSQAMCDTLELSDSQEGLKAFAEKRHPHWQHE